MKYAPTSHSGLTFTPACAAAPAGISSTNASPTNINARANFAGDDGWRRRGQSGGASQARDRRLEMLATDDILDQPQRHTHSGAREPEVPIDSLGDPARDYRPDHRTDVDAHEEDREPGVAAPIPRLVQRPHERRRVGLQQPGADDDEPEAGVEEGQRGESEGEMDEGDDHAPDQHAAS